MRELGWGMRVDRGEWGNWEQRKSPGTSGGWRRDYSTKTDQPRLRHVLWHLLATACRHFCHFSFKGDNMSKIPLTSSQCRFSFPFTDSVSSLEIKNNTEIKQRVGNAPTIYLWLAVVSLSVGSIVFLQCNSKIPTNALPARNILNHQLLFLI